MLEFLQLLRDILRLRRGPQDMPYSRPLLAAVCVADLILQWSVGAFLFPQESSLPLGLIKLAILLGFVYLIVVSRGVANRFVQTATAMEGCSIEIGRAHV